MLLNFLQLFSPLLYLFSPTLSDHQVSNLENNVEIDNIELSDNEVADEPTIDGGTVEPIETRVHTGLDTETSYVLPPRTARGIPQKSMIQIMRRKDRDILFRLLM